MKVREITEYFQTNLYEMSNFSHNKTGLAPKTNLWVRTETEAHPHVKYRIKIDHPQKGSAVFAIWGDEAKQVEGDWIVAGKTLKKLQLLVFLTRQHILNHIDGIEDSGDLSAAFLAVKQQVENI